MRISFIFINPDPPMEQDFNSSLQYLREVVTPEPNVLVKRPVRVSRAGKKKGKNPTEVL